MKRRALGVFAAIFGLAGSAHADGLQSAYGAVGNLLRGRGGGLASFYASCPQGADTWQYVTSALYVPIGQTDSAVIINIGHCDGGNGSGQYVVLNQRGATRLLDDPRIGDMSFLATSADFYDDTLTLRGNRWLDSDPHCCPSKKAELEFNLKTGARKFTVGGD
jgi:hypothetical protein